MNARVTWKRVYSDARRINATGRELASFVCAAIGQPATRETFYGEHGLVALAFQSCLQERHRETRPLFQSLAETVLNGFGTLNPWTRYTWTPAARQRSERARVLRDKLVANGRAIIDAGGWVRGVAL